MSDYILVYVIEFGDTSTEPTPMLLRKEYISRVQPITPRIRASLNKQMQAAIKDNKEVLPGVPPVQKEIGDGSLIVLSDVYASRYNNAGSLLYVTDSFESLRDL